jgi:Helix-turn-helix domain
MDNTTRAPSGAPQLSQFIGTAIHTADSGPNLPSPTVRMLTCVHYLVQPQRDNGGRKPISVSTVKGVLTAMAQHVNPQGLVYLSIERIAHMSGYSDRSVRSALRCAEKQGYIRINMAGGGAGKATCYRVLLLTHYFEAATASKAWTSWQNPERGAGNFEKYPERSSKYPERGCKNPERRSADPIRSEIEPICRPYKTAEETKRYLARVFAQS